MKKLFAILMATALLVFGTTATSLYAKDRDPIDEIPEVYIPMPY
jgi:hypothetical protein